MSCPLTNTECHSAPFYGSSLQPNTVDPSVGIYCCQTSAFFTKLCQTCQQFHLRVHAWIPVSHLIVFSKLQHCKNRGLNCMYHRCSCHDNMMYIKVYMAKVIIIVESYNATCKWQQEGMHTLVVQKMIQSVVLQGAL